MSTTLADKLVTLPEFAGFPANRLGEVAAFAKVLRLGPSEVLFEQGEAPEGLFLLLDGDVELIQNPMDSSPVRIDRLHTGALFGQTALFEEGSSPYRGQMGDAPGILQVLPRADFSAFLDENPDIKASMAEAHALRETTDFLSKTDSLGQVPRAGILKLAQEAETIPVPMGTPIIRQGEVEDHLYIIRKGRYAVVCDEAPNHRIATRIPGNLIGEMAVLKGEARSASIIADEDGEVIRIPGPALRDVIETHKELGRNVEELMRQRFDEVEKKQKERESAEKRALQQAEREARQEKAKAAKKTETVEIKPSWKDRFKKPAAVRQHSQMDCSAACLCTVTKHYGKTISINVAREMARVRQEGASMENVMRAAGELGFNTESYVSTIEQLREKTLPAIANWKGYHWIVVHEVKEDSVVVADPAEGLVTYTIEEFEADWSRYTIFLEPNAKFEVLVESPPSFQGYLHYFTPYKRVILEIFAAAVVLQALSVMMPLFSKFIIDDIIFKGDKQWLTAALVVMGGVAFLNMMLGYVRDHMVLKLSMHCNMELITEIYDRLLRLPIGFFENRRTGDITNRLEQHEEITQFITEDGLETFLSLMTAVAYLFFMFYFNVWLTVLVLFFLFLNIFVVKYISPRIRQVGRESFVKEAEQESHLIESIRGAETLKTIGADFMARWKYENHFADLANLEFKSARLSQMAGLVTGTLDALGDVAVLFLGGAYVIWGDMTIGELVAFTVFANGVQGPISAIIGKWDELQDAYVAVERLNDVMEKEPEFGPGSTESKDALDLSGLRGEIEYRGINFRYQPDDQHNVVQNIDLKIPAGSTVAFVGPSGCGKSTLIKLLYGFHRPSDGDILIDGFEMNDVSLPSLRRQIAMVPQHSLIFKGSVRENISLANEGATMADIVEAAKSAGAHDFISKMPGGYDSQVEEQGANLSGGQRQRLAIARAFLQPASLLVMDEATSALDVESERIIMENMKTRYRDQTVIMIAHRLSTIRHADLIVALNNGLIAESGSHEELMENQGLYYHLSASQLSVE